MEQKDLEVKLAELKKALEAATEKSVKENIENEMKALIAKLPDTKAMETELADLKKWKEEQTKANEKNQKVIDDFVASKGKTDLRSNPGGEIAAELKSKKEEIQSAVKSGIGEVEIKADTLVASVATNNHVQFLDGIGQLGVKKRALYDVFPKITVSNGNNKGTIAYTDWDEDTTVRAAAAVAEGSAFAESTAKFKGYTLALRKIGDSLPVSEEFFEDEQLAAQELASFLSVNVNSEIDDQIVNGDNTGNNLKGLLTSISAYSPAAAGIADANIYDLITKVKSDITTNRGSKYDPDFAAMNQSMVDQLVLKKDANYQYIFPPTHPIYNMIVVDNNLANDVLVVGDSRFGKIYEKPGVLISRGEINAQFTSDMMTIKARKRLNLLIKAVDATGFRKVTSVADALSTLEQPVA